MIGANWAVTSFVTGGVTITTNAELSGFSCVHAGPEQRQRLIGLALLRRVARCACCVQSKLFQT
jgi:hypothetical protein